MEGIRVEIHRQNLGATACLHKTDEWLIDSSRSQNQFPKTFSFLHESCPAPCFTDDIPYERAWSVVSRCLSLPSSSGMAVAHSSAHSSTPRLWAPRELCGVPFLLWRTHLEVPIFLSESPKWGWLTLTFYCYLAFYPPPWCTTYVSNLGQESFKKREKKWSRK